MIPGLRQHHIGCLVENIETFKIENDFHWSGSSYSAVYAVSNQDVKVCFLQFSDDTVIELVEPGPGNLSLLKMIQKGNSFYHLGFITDAYDQSVEKLSEAGFRQISEFSSEAFSGNRCAFFFHPQLRLIELIEGGSKSS